MKMEEGYRELKVGDTCLAVDEIDKKDGKTWRKLSDNDLGIGTNYEESDFIDGYRYRRCITAELDNDLTWLAYNVSFWEDGSTVKVNEGKIGSNTVKGFQFNSASGYTLAQINEEKARWNLPLIEVENPDSSEWVPEVGLECMMMDGDGAFLQVEIIAEKDGYFVGWAKNPTHETRRLFYSNDLREFRPIETTEQKEARERDEWVLNMLHETDGCESFSDSLEIVYDWLKEQKKL